VLRTLRYEIPGTSYSPFAMTTKANVAPKRLRFGMAEPTSHAPANDKFSRLSSISLTTNHQPLFTFLTPQRER